MDEACVDISIGGDGGLEFVQCNVVQFIFISRQHEPGIMVDAKFIAIGFQGLNGIAHWINGKGNKPYQGIGFLECRLQLLHVAGKLGADRRAGCKKEICNDDFPTPIFQAHFFSKLVLEFERPDLVPNGIIDFFSFFHFNHNGIIKITAGHFNGILAQVADEQITGNRQHCYHQKG